VANLAFCGSSILWIFAEAVFTHTFPFALVAYPGLFITVMLLAVYFNDFRILWSGRFEDPEFLNSKSYR